MNGNAQQFPFMMRDPAQGPISLMSMVPIGLSCPTGNVTTSGMADTASTMNVLPHSIGIQLGGIGAMVPERRKDLARLAMRAMIGGTLACCMTGCVVGLLLPKDVPPPPPVVGR